MFRNPKRSSQDTLLPHSGNGRGGGGGLYGTARMTPKASLSKSFIATIIWALVSLCLIGGGWQYCSRNMESTSVKCDMRSCDVTELKSGVLTKLTIPHSLMVRAELVRLKNGQIVDPASLRRSAQRKLGHTYSLVYMEADSEEDDDDSYDSFEDDDDSYDSYDDDDPSSDEGDDDEDDDLPRSRKQAKPTPAAKKAPAPVKREPADPAAAERAARARKVALERKEAQKRMWAEERAAKGLPPIKEPDEQEASQAAARKGGARAARINRDDDGDDERFPGDAGTLREKNLAEIRRMEASQGMAAEGHRDRSQRAYEEAAKKHQARAQIDAQMKQRGNNLHDRGTTPPNRNKPAKENLSPDDPDSPDPARDRARPPKLERQNFEPDLKVENEEGGDAEMKQGGGRKLSSVEGSEEDADAALEEHQRVLTQAKDQVLAEAKGGRGKQGEGFETLGDFVQAGAAGARRKLLGWKQDRMKNVKPATAKPSKEEVAKDAAKARDSHRKGHGHHQKRARKFARPVPTADDDDEQELKAQLDARNKKHHHKAFHHKKEVPQAERHHVHHRFHHQPGQEKIDHGWRHQNRQWHGHREQKKLGTTYSLGRKMARKRKEIIDSYVSRRTTTVDFTDSKKWRAGGLWLIILGCISTAFCIVVGNFQPRPKTKKVS